MSALRVNVLSEPLVRGLILSCLFLLPGAGAAQVSSDGGPPPVIFQEGTGGAPERKNVGLAVLYSLLLPGMGELYADGGNGYSSGKYFTIAEGALWITLAAVDIHAGTMQDDSRAFASQHAGFAPAGKDDDYYADIGNFSDIYAYNEQVLRDRDEHKLYDPATHFWSWDHSSSQSNYRDSRIASEEMYNNTRFVAAAIAINHVLSAINAARIAVNHNEALGTDVEIGARILGAQGRAHGVALTFTGRF